MLSLLSFWDTIFLKDILVWTIFSGLAHYINVISEKSDEKYIKNIIKDNFKLLIILEFLMNTFTFNLFIELLIIPIITIITLLSYSTERDSEYQEVHKLLNSILAILGYIFLYSTIKVGINEYPNLNIVNTLIRFLIPIVYLILTVPLIYVIGLYSNYNSLFLYISTREGPDKKINRKRRLNILKICNYSIRKVRIFQKEYFWKIYIEMPEKEFNNLMNEFKERLKKCDNN